MAKVGCNKYHAKKCKGDGITFDSLWERKRYYQLKLLERAGEISNLQVHVPYVLIEKSQYGRTIKYVADFTYCEGYNLVIEDTKSPVTKTDLYKLKARLFKEKYNMEIKEVFE